MAMVVEEKEVACRQPNVWKLVCLFFLWVISSISLSSKFFLCADVSVDLLHIVYFPALLCFILALLVPLLCLMSTRDLFVNILISLFYFLVDSTDHYWYCLQLFVHWFIRKSFVRRSPYFHIEYHHDLVLMLRIFWKSNFITDSCFVVRH